MQNIIKHVFLDEMKRPGKKEMVLARGKANLNGEGIPYISVVADRAWSKRSYKTNYNALSGFLVIIGEVTRKVLFLAVKNKLYSICLKYAKKTK